MSAYLTNSEVEPFRVQTYPKVRRDRRDDTLFHGRPAGTASPVTAASIALVTRTNDPSYEDFLGPLAGGRAVS